MSTAPCELLIDGLGWPVVVTVNPRAKRLTLRLDIDRRRLKLSRPRGVSERRAVAWAADQAAWVERQLALQEDPIALVPDATIPFDGVPCRIDHCPERGRGVTVNDGRIEVGGPSEGVPGRLARWLRAEARRRLTEETHAMARPAGIDVRAVSVGDASTRWGSCSADGRIRFSWRLILVPADVRRYVVAHEVAHRLHMNHGADFRAAERRLLGSDPAPLRLALRRLAPELRRIRLG